MELSILKLVELIITPKEQSLNVLYAKMNGKV
jgi:hypothetical protein